MSSMMNHGRWARPYATTLLKAQTTRLPLFSGVGSVGLYKSADALARSPEIRSSEATFINGHGPPIGRNSFLKATGSQMYMTNATSRNGNRNAGAVRHAAFTIASTHRRGHMLANKTIRGPGLAVNWLGRHKVIVTTNRLRMKVVTLSIYVSYLFLPENHLTLACHLKVSADASPDSLQNREFSFHVMQDTTV
jgi:hypothetical protein